MGWGGARAGAPFGINYSLLGHLSLVKCTQTCLTSIDGVSEIENIDCSQNGLMNGDKIAVLTAVCHVTVEGRCCGTPDAAGRREKCGGRGEAKWERGEAR